MMDNEKLTFTLSEESINAAAQTHDELLTARASEAMLREALEAVIGDHNAPADCYSTGPLTGDPIKDTRCPSCAAISTLSGSSGEWLERHDAEKDARITALEARVEDLMHGLECMTAKAQEHLAAQYKAEAERDGLVVRCHTCHGTVIFKRTSEGIEFYHSCQSPESFARITTEARRKTLVEVGKLRPPVSETMAGSLRESYMRGRNEVLEYYEHELTRMAQEAPDEAL